MDAEDASARVRVSRPGSYDQVVLDRPEAHNALDVRMRDELFAALRALALTDPSSAVALTGNGPSFCSGGDLDEFGTGADPVANAIARLSRSLPAALAVLAPRVVVGIHGACIGAGVELAAFCGTVVAARSAYFRLPEVAMGLLPGSGGTISVPARIGRGRTLWMLVSGEPVDAQTALAWGLVDRVVPDDELPATMHEIASDLRPDPGR